MLNVADVIHGEIEANKGGAADEEGLPSESAGTSQRPVRNRPDLTMDSRWAVEVEDEVEVGSITDLAAWVDRVNGMPGGGRG